MGRSHSRVHRSSNLFLSGIRKRSAVTTGCCPYVAERILLGDVYDLLPETEESESHVDRGNTTIVRSASVLSYYPSRVQDRCDPRLLVRLGLPFSFGRGRFLLVMEFLGKTQPSRENVNVDLFNSGRRNRGAMCRNILSASSGVVDRSRLDDFRDLYVEMNMRKLLLALV